jgi:hypothetical protein
MAIAGSSSVLVPKREKKGRKSTLFGDRSSRVSPAVLAFSLIAVLGSNALMKREWRESGEQHDIPW